MAMLLTGLVGFIGIHLLPAIPAARSVMIARLGKRVYIGLFSLFSLVTLALLIWAYAAAPFIEVWTPPDWTRLVAAVAMVVALIVLMGGFFPGRIKERVRYPMLVAIKIWAAAHLLANGDLASMLLFAGILVYAVADRVLLNKRDEHMPFQSSAGSRNDLIAVLAGLALYAVIVFALHEWLIGVPVLA